jgi:UDP-N-acetylmuramoyl-L-alanyl-D-glutamate--2,6-diaminopimelate ligase
MKILKDILYKAGIEEVAGNTSVAIESVCFDSRNATEGALFIAVRGTKVDGHNFIDQVISNGTVAIVCEEFPAELKGGITYVRVRDTAIALAHICSNFYDQPSSKIKLIGVTGTNGKTTTVTLLHSLFTKLGYKCGLLSTVRNLIDTIEIPSTHTTPDPLQLNKLLSQMVDAGCTYCFMEVSSHSVVQHRITGLSFVGGLFTNITRDHLDYHKTFDEYIRNKFIFAMDFEKVPDVDWSGINTKAGQILRNTKLTMK